ncbi:MAG TPA: hypothetical protein DEV93_02620, partial [Chloroflexi bacterium]|nr:hypothetical protein [Chloroflexota bacterium]
GVISPFELIVNGGNASAVAQRLAKVQDIRGVIAPADPTWRRGSIALIDVFPNADASSSAGR